MPFVDIAGPITGDTVYMDNTLVAKDVEAVFPEVTPTVAEVVAMGKMSLPIYQLLDNMELSITKIGVDLGFRAMTKPETSSLEIRFIQTKINENGKTTIVGCKAFFKCIPVKIPGITITLGESSSNEMTYAVMRYQLFVDGVEMFLIDRLAGIVRIDGKDYMQSVNSLL